MTNETLRTATAAGTVSSQRIAGILRGEIVGGEIPPGTWLRQDELATRLGVSRLPVREALRILESEGLSETLPNRGARVPVLDLAEVNTYYKMRERLEPLTLSESMPHLSEEQIGRMERIQRDIEQCTDVNRFLALDRDFHMASYEACPAPQLLSLTVRMWNSTQHYRRAFMQLASSDRLAIVNAEHCLILNAVKRGDAEDAERCLAGHLRRTRVELNRHQEVFETPQPANQSLPRP